MARTGVEITTRDVRGTEGLKYRTGTTKDATGDVIFPPAKSYGARGTEVKFWWDKNNILLPKNWTKKFDDYFYLNDTKIPDQQKSFKIDERLADIAYEARTWLGMLQEAMQDQKEYDAYLKTIGTVASLINAFYGTLVTLIITVGTKEEKEFQKTQIKNLKNTVSKLEREAAYLQIWKEKVALNQLNALIEENSRSANVDSVPVWVYLTGVILIIWIIKRRKK